MIFNENYSNCVLKKSILKKLISKTVPAIRTRGVKGMIRRVFMSLLRIYRLFRWKMDISDDIGEKHEKEPPKYSFYL